MSATVLFVCIHNSARSQMAEAFVNELSGGAIVAQSAGLEPGTLNPFVVGAMRESGIDISANPTKSVAQMLESGQAFSYVVTVCDDASAERCPIFPGGGERLHWSFEDPSASRGTAQERLQKAREVRDLIRARVADWLSDLRR